MQNTGIQNLNHLDLNSGNKLKAIESPDNKKSSTKQLQQKSWMINLFFKCPVIGTCLSLEEQKKVLKKTGYCTKNLSAFKIHQILVESLENENDISSRVDTYLNKKFHREVFKYLLIDESDFLKEWRNHFGKGLIEGIFWVAATRSDLSTSAICSIFGDIHMQMHLNSEQNRKDRHLLTYQQEENRKLTQRLKEVNQINRRIKKEKERIEKELVDLKRINLSLGKEKNHLEKELSEWRKEKAVQALEAENCQLKEKIEKLSGVIKDYQQNLKLLENQNNKLLSKFDSQKEIKGNLRKKSENVIKCCHNLNQYDGKDTSLELSNKHILIVGGITKLEAFYRKLIEEKGGIFEYHDGYMNGGSNGLENKIRRADVVLCPVNCNSHNACSMVKRFSKKYEKPVNMLANSSLSSISQSLFEYQKSVII